MKANNILRNGHLAASILGITLISATLVGCGTDLSTKPGGSLETRDSDDIGTLPIPVRGASIPVPQGLTGEIIGANTTLLRWKVTSGPYSVLVKLDGREIATVPLADGQLMDASIKSPGTHVYDVCLTRGKNCGAAGHVMLEFAGQRGSGDERRGDDDKVGEGSE